MKSLFDWVMNRRARVLTERLHGCLPAGSRVADIGSGTGHNAERWRADLKVEVDEFDVADLHWVGAGPIPFDGQSLPVSTASYDVAALLFVLQYARDPVALLREVRRACSGHVVIVQSTCRGPWGRFWLGARELIWGRFAFHIARLARMVHTSACPLASLRAFSRTELRKVIDEAGFCIETWETEEWHGLNISRDLIVLVADHTTPTSPSSSRPAMKSAG
ncbi:MAG: methyltransferase domain-containing protein [Planctomycetaceae bacterium]|nr:MAG: methyltransferase domain-containing protein [Planctomycetaceae bacterium]